jgi:hypothetical protein
MTASFEGNDLGAQGRGRARQQPFKQGEMKSQRLTILIRFKWR